MSASRKHLWRGLALIAAAVILQSQMVGIIEASRDSATCVQTCNSVRTECKGQCEVDCAILFPPGQARNSCISACEQGCNDESQECKAKCNIKKNPPSPNEP